MGISDNRGLKGTIQLKTDTGILEAIPGLKDADLFTTGISFPANLTIRDKKFSFSESLKLSGSDGLSFTPVGKTTEVVINSKWKSPGFRGNFLPVERLLNESGFNAKWLVTNLNRNFPQTWSGKAYNTGNDSFGVDFILPVDHYQKSLRSAKYGILFIALTFMALIFSELAIKEKIHVFQYMSEYIGFNFAYLTASSSIIFLISFYLMKLLKNRFTVYLISGLLVLLFAFIFILLTLNDFAYLAGNIGLFVLLALTMMLSVKLDLFKNQANPNI
jgi:inner membrane protein